MYVTLVTLVFNLSEINFNQYRYYKIMTMCTKAQFEQL